MPGMPIRSSDLDKIHRLKLRGRRIVLDVAGGSVHEVDEVAWEVLGHWALGSEGILAVLGEKFGRSEVAGAIEELEGLRAQGLLFSDDSDLREFEPPESPVKSLCLHIAHDCNLHCDYCFAEGGPFGGDRRLMSPEVARAAVDFLVAASGGRAACEIDFFGGEPLINFDVVRETVSYARRRGAETGKVFGFTLTTNALTLTEEHEDYLNREGISLILSLDGRPEVHDRHRRVSGGRGSYRLIMPRIQRCLRRRREAGTPAYAIVRGTYTRDNLDFAQDIRHLVEAEITDLSLEPVVAPQGCGYDLREEDLEAVGREYWALADFFEQARLEGRPFSFFHFNLGLDRGPCLPRLLTGCGAGYQYLAVTPTGDLYPCHQFVGQTEYLIGNVLNGGIRRPDLVARFRRLTVFRKQGCSECWARYYCGGGCHANAARFSGDLTIPHAVGCGITRSRLEPALWLAAGGSRMPD